MNLDQAYKQANKAPVKIDNHLMIVAADGDYLAKIDASEGHKWSASAALLCHGFNNMQGTVKALRTALEVISDCHMPKTYHKSKTEVIVEIVDALEKAESVTI